MERKNERKKKERKKKRKKERKKICAPNHGKAFRLKPS
jgi:hypothetical protein